MYPKVEGADIRELRAWDTKGRAMRQRALKICTTFLLMVLLSASAWAISTEQEIQMGAQAAAQFEQKYGLVNDPALVGRLNRVGQQLIQNAQRKDLPWRFRVINVDAFNAVAFPGGFVYATKGLMQGLTDEELAFVVGHEIGHADLRHSVKKIESDQLRRLGLIAIAAGATGGNVDQGTATMVQLTDTVIGSQYSQAVESEADRYGMRLMAKGGYDPAFALAALQKLAAQSGGGTPDFLNSFLGSHPLTKDRINQGVGLIPSIPYKVAPLPPVNVSSGRSQTGRGVYADADSALEYTLSLLGNGHRASLQTMAEDLATGRRQSTPAGIRVVRASSDRSLGLSGLETVLLAHPEFERHGQAFGAAVVDAGAGRIEVVVLLEGGR